MCMITILGLAQKAQETRSDDSHTVFPAWCVCLCARGNKFCSVISTMEMEVTITALQTDNPLWGP